MEYRLATTMSPKPRYFWRAIEVEKPEEGIKVLAVTEKLHELLVDAIAGNGRRLFDRVWELDLEGIAQVTPALVREKQEGREAALAYMKRQLPAIVQDEDENADIARQAKQPLSAAHSCIWPTASTADYQGIRPGQSAFAQVTRRVWDSNPR